MSARSDSQSTILPLPSSPHCAPTTTTLPMVLPFESSCQTIAPAKADRGVGVDYRPRVPLARPLAHALTTAAGGALRCRGDLGAAVQGVEVAARRGEQEGVIRAAGGRPAAGSEVAEVEHHGE